MMGVWWYICMYDGYTWMYYGYMSMYDGYMVVYVDVLRGYGGICGCLMGIWGHM